MSFPDPVTLTVNSIAKTLNRIGTGDLTSTYATSDEEFVLTITHQKTNKGRIRSTLELVHKKVVSDPLTSVNDFDQMTIRHLIDRPLFGWDDAELNYDVAALAAFESSTNITKLFGLQS